VPISASRLIVLIFNFSKKADVALCGHNDNKDTIEDISLGLSSDKRAYFELNHSHSLVQ